MKYQPWPLVGSILHSLVNPVQPLKPTLVPARHGLRRALMRELRARQDLGSKSEPTRGGRGKQGQERGAKMTAQQAYQ